tara:strand:- start:55 stop:447 length:393 start_codon:yes stop_codon:yes gene_type:complete
MEIIQPEFRCGGNWQELAKLFKYKIEEGDQDWTYTIAEPKRIDEYIVAYETVTTDEDTKFSLMEMIIQALTNQENEDLINSNWKKVQILLNKDFELHKYTIYYWCCWENNDLNDCWEVTPLMRQFWLDKK